MSKFVVTSLVKDFCMTIGFQKRKKAVVKWHEQCFSKTLEIPG